MRYERSARRALGACLATAAVLASSATPAAAGHFPGNGGHFPEQPGSNVNRGCEANLTNPRHMGLTPAPTPLEMPPATLRVGSLFLDACFEPAS